MTQITILDGHTTNPGDLSWAALEVLGQFAVYDRTLPGQVLERAGGADILLTNKTVLDAGILSQLPRLRFISVLATGYNVVDVEAAARFGIAVSNVKGYAANSVAQRVFSLLLELADRPAAHSTHVAAGGWQASPDWSYTLSPTKELAGKTLGIYGFGQIGQRVAEIGLAFGMEVIACHKHPERDRRPGVRFVPFDEMMALSDAVTLHAPLTEENRGIVNRVSLAGMKRTAYLLNTGRGGLVVEPDLREALESGVIAGAGLDVLSEEPPAHGNILIGAKNCLVTPHNAWATVEARSRLIAESAENVRAFLEGKQRNRIETKVAG